MLPLFTTTQLNNGIDHTDYKIDLSDYMKKKDVEQLATKEELLNLTQTVAGKLDASPQHKHHIDDIKQLETQLDSKFDKLRKPFGDISFISFDLIKSIEKINTRFLKFNLN